jgi:hypothetical protein
MSLAAPTEFNHDGVQYRIKKLNAIEQWHLNRKIAPLIPPLIPVFLKMARESALAEVMAKEREAQGKAPVDTAFDVESIAGLLGPFAEGIATMSDSDSEYVINTCLSAIQRNISANVWMPVWSVAAKASQFPELNDLSNVLPLVIKVIWDALGPFIKGLLTAQASQTQAA